jgi:hypothetical protein
MSKARDEYYRFHQSCCEQANTYIKELEAEKADLMSDIFNIKNKYEKIESENMSLTESITDIGLEKIKLESEKAELIHEFTVLKNGCKNEAIQGFCESVLNKFKEVK